MASEKTTAIVIRLVEFSETSLIVTLLTPEFGKVSAMAKGARRPKSSCEGALDLLSLCRVVMIRKSGDTLDLLTEAKLEKRFRAAEYDLHRLYAGYYVAELIRELTDENDSSPELFQLTCDALADLDGDMEVDLCLLRFELQMLRILGHMPSLDSCAVCGKSAHGSEVDAAPSKRIPFGCQAGGVLCPACKQTARGVVLLRLGSLQWMRGACTESIEPVPRDCRGELRGLLNQYISNLAGMPLRMKSLITRTAQ